MCCSTCLCALLEQPPSTSLAGKAKWLHLTLPFYSGLQTMLQFWELPDFEINRTLWVPLVAGFPSSTKSLMLIKTPVSVVIREHPVVPFPRDTVIGHEHFHQAWLTMKPTKKHSLTLIAACVFRDCRLCRGRQGWFVNCYWSWWCPVQWQSASEHQSQGSNGGRRACLSLPLAAL